MLRIAQLLRPLLLILITTIAQSIQFLRLALSSRAALCAEVLFLRKELASTRNTKFPLGFRAFLRGNRMPCAGLVRANQFPRFSLTEHSSQRRFTTSLPP